MLYTGVTNDLRRRVFEHKNRIIEGFTKKYNADKLVYYEICANIEGTITREKQLKGGSRQDKLNLIETNNKEWRDLYNEL